MLRRSSRPQQDHQVLAAAAARAPSRTGTTKQAWRTRGWSHSHRATDGRDRRFGGTATRAIGIVLASLAGMLIVADFVVYGNGSDRFAIGGSSLLAAVLFLKNPYSSSRGSSSLSREMQVQKLPWPHAERGRQQYRRVVALGDIDPNSSTRVGADLYYLRDRKRQGPARRYPKMVDALANFEYREISRRSLFRTIELDKLTPMARRLVSLPFYNGLRLFAVSDSQRVDKESMLARFGRTLLDPEEDEARLAQQKLAIWDEMEQFENDHSQGNVDVSPECMRRANVLFELSTCNAFHERRVGDVDDDNDLSGDYLNLLLSRCECRLSLTS